MSYIDQTLMDDEKVLYLTKPHWIMFTPALGWLFLAILIFIFGPNYHFANVFILNTSYTLTDILGIIAVIVAFFSGLVAYINYQTSEFAITNRRILMKIGFISRISLEILLQKVESIQVFQSILGRIFNYGTLTVSGTGGSKDLFPNIAHPLLFRRYAQQQLSKLQENREYASV
jgi:uncharacterized membrane protein YdbT with pleckstrin-like domain